MIFTAVLMVAGLAAPGEWSLALDWPGATDADRRELTAASAAVRPGSWSIVPPRTDAGRGLLVRIRERDRRYQVETTPFDADSGIVGPPTRVHETADRFMVARLVTAGCRDLNPVGAVEAIDADRARVRTEGRVEVGQLFAVFANQRWIPGTLLKVEAIDDGGAVTRILSRYVNPLSATDRPAAIALAVDRAPLNLLVIDATGKPADGLSVRVSPTGHSPNDSITDQARIRGGRFRSTGEYDGLAFVTVADGERIVARVPVPVQDGTVVEISVARGGEVESLATAADEVWACRRRLHELALRLVDLNERIKPMLTRAENAPARDAVREVVNRIEAELPGIKADAGRLRSVAGGEELAGALAEIEARRDELIRLAADLDKAARAARDPALASRREQSLALVRRAEREAEDADFDKALATYAEVLRAGDWPEIRQRRDTLAAAWALQGVAHREAREFIYQKFARTDRADELIRHVERAKSALAEFQRVGDKLSPRKLFLELLKLADRLAKWDEAARAANPVGADRLAELKTLSSAVQELFEQVEARLREK